MDRDKLSEVGVDVNQGIRRLNNNTEFYEKLLDMFLDDNTLFELEEAIKNKNIDEAFVKAHSLKGIAGNLSFIKLHAFLIPLVETLRMKSLDGIDEMMKPVKKNYLEIKAVIKDK